MIERTFMMMKPDAVQRGITGEIIDRFENAGLKIVGMKMVWMSNDFSKKHYEAHIKKPFYKGLEDFITGFPRDPGHHQSAIMDYYWTSTHPSIVGWHKFCVWVVLEREQNFIPYDDLYDETKVPILGTKPSQYTVFCAE